MPLEQFAVLTRLATHQVTSSGVAGSMSELRCIDRIETSRRSLLRRRLSHASATSGILKPVRGAHGTRAHPSNRSLTRNLRRPNFTARVFSRKHRMHVIYRQVAASDDSNNIRMFIHLKGVSVTSYPVSRASESWMHRSGEKLTTVRCRSPRTRKSRYPRTAGARAGNANNYSDPSANTRQCAQRLRAVTCDREWRRIHVRMKVDPRLSLVGREHDASTSRVARIAALKSLNDKLGSSLLYCVCAARVNSQIQKYTYKYKIYARAMHAQTLSTRALGRCASFTSVFGHKQFTEAVVRTRPRHIVLNALHTYNAHAMTKSNQINSILSCMSQTQNSPQPAACRPQLHSGVRAYSERAPVEQDAEHLSEHDPLEHRVSTACAGRIRRKRFVGTRAAGPRAPRMRARAVPHDRERVVLVGV